MQIIVSGIEARGRNGFYKVRQVGIVTGSENTVIVDFWGQRFGKQPPALLMGNRKEMLDLLTLIQDAIENLDELTPKESEHVPEERGKPPTSA